MAAAKMERTRHPGIYRRGGRYVIVWQHRGRQHKEYFASLAEAREAKGRRSAGDRRKVERVRFDGYAERWIESYRGRTARGFSETTRIEYRRDVAEKLVPYFEGWRLDEIDAGDVKEWFGWLEDRGASPSAIRKAKATLSALMGDALEERKIRFNPVLGVRYVPRTPVGPKPKPRGLTVTELEQFMTELHPRRLREHRLNVEISKPTGERSERRIAALREQIAEASAELDDATARQWRLFFALLAHSGIRIGEALGLRWEHVHLGDDPHLDVREQVYRGRRKERPKSDHGIRRLPLSPGMAVALDRHRRSSEYAGSGSPVFASVTGTAIDYSALRRRVLTPAIEASGIDWPKGTAFHMFRKTAASLIHDSGKTSRQLADWLGHHDPAFTIRTYVGQVDDGLGDAGFLDELIPVEGGQGVGNTPPGKPADAAEEPRVRLPLSQAENGDQPVTSRNGDASS